MARTVVSKGFQVDSPLKIEITESMQDESASSVGFVLPFYQPDKSLKFERIVSECFQNPNRNAYDNKILKGWGNIKFVNASKSEILNFP
jgi:hypothetical protein